MKVLLVSDFLPPVMGGLEGHVAALARELSVRGHEVHIATLTYDPTPVPGVVIHSVAAAARLLPHEDAARPFAAPVPDPVAHHRLAAILREFDPDVIHGHNGLWASVPAHTRAPLILTAHDYALICQLRTLLHQPGGEQCSGPRFAKCVRCGSAVLGAGTSLGLTAATATGRRLRRPARILAVSRAVRSRLRPFARSRIDVVPNFVEPDTTDMTPAALPSEVPPGGYVLYAGANGPHKGLPDLLALWAGPARPAATLVVASPHPPSSLPPGVVAVTLDRAQMTEAWSRAHVAVVPSRWPEPCPTVVLEAMQSGTPVVASRVGGIPDLVDDGVEGLLVAPSDPDALGRALTRVLADDALRGRMGAAGIQRAKFFGRDVVVGRIESIYHEVVADARIAADVRRDSSAPGRDG